MRHIYFYEHLFHIYMVKTKSHYLLINIHITTFFEKNMLLILNRQITRFRYENEKVSSDPSYSLQNEAMEIFLIFFELFWFFSNPKPSLPILRTLKMFIGDSSFVWKLFSWKWPTPRLYFFSHNLVTYDGYVRKNYNILIFFEFFKNIWTWFWQITSKNDFSKKCPYTEFIFFYGN